eukprot:11161088-Karenia_brevis.AAC.1
MAHVPKNKTASPFQTSSIFFTCDKQLPCAAFAIAEFEELTIFRQHGSGFCVDCILMAQILESILVSSPHPERMASV